VSFFIDTHCHLNFNSFENDLPQVLERAGQADVRMIVIPGTDLDSSRSAVELAGLHPGLFAAVGVHPNDAETWEKNTSAALISLAASPRVIAIGEIGLDYYRDRARREKQMEALIGQLGLAAEMNLPVIIHNRESFHDLWPILREWAARRRKCERMPGVLHSFDGDSAAALEAYGCGFYIGISGPVTYKNLEARRNVVESLPLEAIVLETDAPFLTPNPHRGRRNEPAYIPLIAAEVARVKQMDSREVQLATTRNAMQLFSLGSID
jgi:TatD DNase family protein